MLLYYSIGACKMSIGVCVCVCVFVIKLDYMVNMLYTETL